MIKDHILSMHAEDMLIEREIPDDWIFECIKNPDFNEWENNEILHYIKAISEYENRYLRVVVNPYSQPKKVITFFFDRRIQKK